MRRFTRWMRIVGVLPAATYLWIVFRTVVTVTGVMALRNAAPQRQERVLVAR